LQITPGVKEIVLYSILLEKTALIDQLQSEIDRLKKELDNKKDKEPDGD